jgi:hypothetical protein
MANKRQKDYRIRDGKVYARITYYDEQGRLQNQILGSIIERASSGGDYTPRARRRNGL